MSSQILLATQAVKAVVKIIKKRFPNLTTEDTTDIAVEIVEAIIFLQQEKV